MPDAEIEHALPWFAAQVVKDRRFVQAMVANVYEMIMGRRPMSLPKDSDQPGYLGRLHAYTLQQSWLRDVEQTFVDENYNFKTIVRAVVTSPYYRASSVDMDLWQMSEDERSAYDGIGLSRLLTPEQLDRKINAIFGESWIYNDWSALTSNRMFYMLYAGIDSLTVLERLRTMSPLMASIATLISGEISCRFGRHDFDLAQSERRLFPYITPQDTTEHNDPAIRRNIQHLYAYVLGEDVALDSPEVEIMRTLFMNVRADGVAEIEAGNTTTRGTGTCARRDDDTYSVRAWHAVLTTMLEDWNFLYH